MSVDSAHAFIDGALRAESRKASCRVGCFHCCREPVYAAGVEVEHLLSGVPSGSLQGLKSRVGLWWERFHQAGLEKMPRTPRERDYSQLLGYRSTMLWCPLLVGGLCTAYDRRPINCRAHLAIGPAWQCENDTDRPAQVFVKFRDATPHIVAMGHLANGARQFQFHSDHLGIWLGRLLLGHKTSSAAAEEYHITFKD